MPDLAFKRFGKYEIQAELGRGGFGRVFRAFDPTVGRLVAIKILTSEAGTDLLNRFRNEATAAGNLRHENIVTIYEFGEEKGVPFLAMEYLEGEDLQQAMAAGTTLTLLDKISIMTQTAAGLDCAHRNGVVHRDVKPANIRLLPDGTVKIMDFGIARLIRDEGARLTRQGHVIGTLLYMSPEQVMGSDTDSLSDIFAYGVTFYELLTSRHPFRAEDPRSIFYKITSEDPELIHQLVPDCPETLDQVIRRALQKDRELRYQTLRDLRLDIEPVLIELRRERAVTLVGDAHRLVDDRNLERACSLLNEAIDLDPANQAARQLRDAAQTKLRRQMLRPRIEALVTKASQSITGGNYADAIQALNAALRLDPDDETLQARSREALLHRDQSLESARLLTEARADLGQGQLDEAMHKASEAVALNPKSIDARSLVEIVQREIDKHEGQKKLNEKLEQAREFLSLDSLDEALGIVNALDATQRDAPEALQLIARLDARKGELARHEKLRNELTAARDRVDRGQFSDAIELLNRLHLEFPSELQVETLLSQARQELAAFEKMEVIEEAILRCEELGRENQFDQALATLDESIRQYPDEHVLAHAHESIAAKQRAALLNQIERDVRHHLENQEFDQALQVLAEASSRLSSNPPKTVAVSGAPPEGLASSLAVWRRAAAPFGLDSQPILASLQEDVFSAKAAWDAARERDEAIRSAVEEAEAREKAGEAAQREQEILRAGLEARELAGVHEFEQAIEVVNNVEARWPGEPGIDHLRAEITAMQSAWIRECEEAASELERARRAETLRIALQEVAQRCAEPNETGSLAEAARVLQKAMRDFPGEPELAAAEEKLRSEWARRRRLEATRRAVDNAQALLNQGNKRRAVELLETAAAQHPEDPMIASALANAREASGEQQKAEAAEPVSPVNAHNRLAPGDATVDAFADHREPPGRLVRSPVNAHNRLAPGDATVDAFADHREPPGRLVRSEGSAAAPKAPAREEDDRGSAPQNVRSRGRRKGPAAQETRASQGDNDFQPALQTKTAEIAIAAASGEQNLPAIRETALSPNPNPNFEPAIEDLAQNGPKPVAQPRSHTSQFPKLALVLAGCVLALVAVLTGMWLLRYKAATTLLTVETEPPGAAVRIGERFCAATACQLELPAGHYRVQARLAGYAEASQNVSIDKEKSKRVQLVLTPLPASLVVTSSFTNGSVYLDEKPVGHLSDGRFSANELQTGPHRLRIASAAGEASLSFKTAPGRAPEMDGNVEAGGTSAIVATSMGSSVRAVCFGCEGALLLDGKPLDGKAIENGDHELSGSVAAEEPAKVFFRTGNAPAIAVHLISTASPEGALVVETNMDGASVVIDHRTLNAQTQGGRLMIPLEPRDYTIEMRKQGYVASPERLVAKIRKGEQFRAVFRLDPKPPTVTLSSVQEGATVLKQSPQPSQQTAIQTAMPPAPQTATATTQAAPQVPQPSPEEIAAGEWASVRSGKDRASIQAFLQKYPNTARRPEALELLAQFDWNALDRKDRAALERFAASHNGSPLAQQAASEIARIDKETTAAAAKKVDDQSSADRSEISKVLSVYAAAFNDKDLNLLKKVWPGLPEAALARAFRGKGQIRSQLRPLAPIELNGDRATVRCTRITEQITEFGRQKPVEDARTVHFHREGGSWVISAID